MFPVQRGLYDHRSTMNQFAKPECQLMSFDPFPYTNANLTNFSNGSKSPLMPNVFPGDEIFDQDLLKEDELNNNLSDKKLLSKAERRAEHNAIERARRESLNTKFQSLAQILPNLNNYRRPSKSQIVEKALDWVKQSLSREERYRYQILQLQRENKRVMAQIMSQEQLHQLQHCHENIPVPRQSVSTPTRRIATSNNTSSVTNIYPSGFNSTDGWSNSSRIPDPNNQIYTLPSADELVQQKFSPRSDDEATVSSTNEDEAEFRSSCNTSVFMDQNRSDKQAENQQQFMTPELCSAGFSLSQAHFDPNLINHWNYSKQDNLNGVNLDPGANGRSSPFHMFS
ncbi:hypothetical protein BDF21DRAFT_449716 [Thamnidium elegans]|nr:hypothetical protein BDF21DRAFT_449716 [Thamnidium elegans]